MAEDCIFVWVEGLYELQVQTERLQSVPVTRFLALFLQGNTGFK
jgi:hypothetical protein